MDLKWATWLAEVLLQRNQAISTFNTVLWSVNVKKSHSFHLFFISSCHPFVYCTYLPVHIKLLLLINNQTTGFYGPHFKAQLLWAKAMKRKTWRVCVRSTTCQEDDEENCEVLWWDVIDCVSESTRGIRVEEE